MMNRHVLFHDFAFYSKIICLFLILKFATKMGTILIQILYRTIIYIKIEGFSYF